MKRLIKKILKEDQRQMYLDKIIQVMKNDYPIFKNLIDYGFYEQLSEDELNYVLRRLLNNDDLLYEMKKNSLRTMKVGDSLIVMVSKGANFTAGEHVPWHDEEGTEYDNDVYNNWKERYKNFLINTFGDETEKYLRETLSGDIFNYDGNSYVFWKHSDRYGGSGFKESFKTWGDLIIRFGWWFALDWGKIKSNLDQMENGTLLILKPNDKGNSMGYYFSIIKKN